MKRKKLIIRILAVLIAIAVVASVVAYFVLQPDRPWMALYVAGMGGLIVVNLSLILFFVHKNLKK